MTALSIAPGTHPRTHLSGIDGTEQPFNLFVPKAHETGEARPLVVVLHGITATWQSWFDAVAIRETAEREGWIVAAPHGRGDSFYLGAGERDVLEVIDEVKRLCRVDESRVFLMGHSMGGWGTWSLACSHPDLFAAIAPMSGWAPLERIENLEHLAPIIFHGTDDIPVPVEHSREAAARLSELGIEHSFTELPGVGHESSMISDVLPQIADWFRERQRVEEPDHVCIKSWTPSRGRNHWLRLVEMKDRTKIAHLEGTREGGEMNLVTENVERFAMAVAPEVWVAMRSAGKDGWVKTDDGEVKNNPVLANLAEPIADVPKRIATILAQRFDADAALLHRNLAQAALAAGDVTAEDVLDLYFRPAETLCKVRVRVGDVLSADLPEWWGEAVLAPEPADRNADGMIWLVCLGDVAHRMGIASESLAETVPTALMSYVINGGVL